LEKKMMLSSRSKEDQHGKRKFEPDENGDVNNDDDIDKNNSVGYEYVMIVPKKLTKHAQNVIYSRSATPLRYHLEGRFGSRTHQINESHMGLPLTSLLALDDSEAQLEKLASQYEDLRALINSEGVSFSYKPYCEPASHRARPPPSVDARIHPEREPEGRGNNTFWKKFIAALKPTIPIVRTSSAKQNNDLENTTATIHQMNHLSLRKKQDRFTYAELFAGMGGFGVALDALGGKCIFVSELEEHLRELYHHNFVTLHNTFQKPSDDDEQKSSGIDIPIHGDIYQVPDASFPSCTSPDPDSSSLDLLVGGFPCQPFTALGQQPGLKCPKGNLFLEIVRVLRLSRPKAFLLENVPGLVGMEETFKVIVAALEDEGYTVTSEMCSARGLTVTGRKRLFLVGLRREKIENNTGNKNEQFEFPFIPDLDLTFRDVLDYDNLPSEELDILRLSDSTFDQLLNNKRWRPSRLAWPNVKGDTLTSHYGNSVGRGESQLVPCKAPHPPRRLSVREMARMMGFPNSYEFLPPRERQSPMGYRKEQYRAIGNAVCPPLIAALAGAVLDRCPNLAVEDCDWVHKGREVAVQLAMAATRPPADLPRGCLLHRIV